jgi:hypothetical protein
MFRFTRNIRVSRSILIFTITLAMGVVSDSAYANASHKEPLFEIPLSENIEVQQISEIVAYAIKYRAFGNYTQRQGIDLRPTETIKDVRAMSAYLFRDTHLIVPDDGWRISGDLSVTIWKDDIDGGGPAHGHEGRHNGTLLFTHTFAMEDIPIWRSFEESIIPTVIPFDEPITFEAGEQYYIFFERDIRQSAYANDNGEYALYVPKDTSSDADPTVSWIRCTYYGQCQTPFLAEIPFALYDYIPGEYAECCSSVLFIPGIQASRLYNSEEKLWEPGQNEDVLALSMTENGEPINTDIYTDDIILESSYCAPDILCGFNIYKKFAEMLDTLVEDDEINAWQAFPYDWRYSAKDILEDGVEVRDGDTFTRKYLSQEVRRLAEESDTGKVTIITHSNGGLLAKALIEKLRAEDNEDIIDMLILTASPQIGTPTAIAGMLHGEKQDLPKHLGWFMARHTAREVARNFESMYSLLPYSEYFSQVLDPPVIFDSTSITTKQFRDLYGVALTNEGELKNFLLGDPQSDFPREVQPSADSISTPYILNSTLFTRAEEDATFFTSLESGDIPTVQIIGWGVDTIKAIEYKDKNVRDSEGNIQKVLDHAPVITEDGDGTVVVPSAAYLDTDSFYMNLKDYNKLIEFRRNRKHADILEADPVRDLLSLLIRKEGVEGIEHISEIKPEPKQDDKRIRLRVHSPLALGITDSFGNYTGVVKDEGGNIVRIAEEIPNSYYWEIGEGKYLGLDTADTYSVGLEGTGEGTFTIEIDEVLGGTVLSSATFVSVPVYKETKAHMVLNANELELESELKPELSIDIDGNGEDDVVLVSGDEISIADLFALLLGMISGLSLPESPNKKILKDIEALEESIEEESHKYIDKEKTQTEIDKLLKTIEWLNKDGHTSAEDTRKLENLVVFIQDRVLE